MDVVTGIAGGMATSVGVAVIARRLIAGQRTNLHRIEALLRVRGAMTLDEIAKELRTSVFMKGYLLQALDQMVREGKLDKAPPPSGTPRLRIFRETRYRSITSG